MRIPQRILICTIAFLAPAAAERIQGNWSVTDGDKGKRILISKERFLLFISNTKGLVELHTRPPDQRADLASGASAESNSSRVAVFLKQGDKASGKFFIEGYSKASDGDWKTSSKPVAIYKGDLPKLYLITNDSNEVTVHVITGGKKHSLEPGGSVLTFTEEVKIETGAAEVSEKWKRLEKVE